jgi:formimidoylglutamate deiminase
LEAHAVDLCVGSDSQATIDLLAEVRALEGHARALARRRVIHAPPGDRHALAARLLDIATRGGSRSLGAPVSAAPGVAVGAPADLVAIDLERTAAAGVPPLEAAAFVATPEWVTDVWVGGARIVADGRHPERERIVTAARPWLGAP